MRLHSLSRLSLPFVAGLVLAIGINTALASGPSSTPPNTNVSPNFYAVNLDEDMYIGYDSSITPYDTSYLLAAPGYLAVGYSTPGDKAYTYLNETSGIFVQRDNPSDGNGAVTAIINTAGATDSALKGSVDGTQSDATGYVGYLDATGAGYGLYTTDNIYGGSLLLDSSGAVYADNIYTNSGSLQIVAGSGVQINSGDFNVLNGKITGESMGTFDYDYASTTSSTSVSTTCDGANEVLIACSGRSTSSTANFLGAYQSGSTTCWARRTDTSGTLYVYAYCFDPTT